MQHWLAFFANYQPVVFTDNFMVLQGLLRRSTQDLAVHPLYTTTLLAALQ